MTTILYSHPACLGHDTGLDHPESVARLEMLLDRLDDAEFSALVRRDAPVATHDQLARVHGRAYVARILGSLPAEGRADLEAGTRVSPGSGVAARHAAGAVCAAVDAVMAGDADNAFCAVRPPGHHAGPEQAMGFCLFNNVAVGAAHARAAHGLERVAIVDFDVHHGNGTQNIFRHDAGTFFGSVHQNLIFPRTGAASERGAGNIFNIPVARGCPGGKYRMALAGSVYPALKAFAPELIFVSAGFDAHVGDPLGGCRLNDADFGAMTRDLLDIAAAVCGGRVVSALEGGYDPRCLASSAAAHVRELMAAPPAPPPAGANRPTAR